MHIGCSFWRAHGAKPSQLCQGVQRKYACKALPTTLLSSLPVKPDPPESVVAKPVPNNPRRLEVSWQNPSSWPDPESFPLKFFLRYRPLILDQWQHVSDAALPGMRGAGNKRRYKKVFRDKTYVYLLLRQPSPCSSPSPSCCFSLPLHLSRSSHSAYKWLCSLFLLRIFIHGPDLLSIHMFCIKLANEM